MDPIIIVIVVIVVIIGLIMFGIATLCYDLLAAHYEAYTIMPERIWGIIEIENKKYIHISTLQYDYLYNGEQIIYCRGCRSDYSKLPMGPITPRNKRKIDEMIRCSPYSNYELYAKYGIEIEEIK